MLGIKHILKLLFERKELFLGFKIVKKWAWILILVFKLLKSLQKAKIDFFKGPFCMNSNVQTSQNVKRCQVDVATFLRHEQQ